MCSEFQLCELPGFEPLSSLDAPAPQGAGLTLSRGIVSEALPHKLSRACVKWRSLIGLCGSGKKVKLCSFGLWLEYSRSK